MAINYSELARIRSNIENDLNNLTNLFSSFSLLIDENVNNQSVWQGASSQQFKKDWTEFEDSKFPVYKRIFQKEINTTMATIKAYQESEGQ